MPENTVPAFAHALSLGVTTLELDCAITRDGVVVVSHDAILNPDITRDGGGAWLKRPGPAISHLTFATLQGYDVGRIRPGSGYAARFPLQRAIDGTRVPALSEVLALARRSGNEQVRFNIETKVSPLDPQNTPDPETFARKVIETVRAADMQKRVTVQSFDWRTLQIVQREAPDIATVYLTAQRDFMDNIRTNENSSPWTAGLHVSAFGGSIPQMVRAAGGAVWSPYYADLTQQSLSDAHQLGLKVIVWTVNEASDIRRMISLRVDGIISDYPDRVRRAAADAGLPLPAPSLLH
jgi:glycerophosphoryl diester phosphodiesterase